MPQQLPSGRWRTRVRHPRSRKQISAHTIVGGPTTFENEHDARDAENRAATALATSASAGTTVRAFWTDWTADTLWLRPAESTNIHNRERTAKFVSAYGDRAIRSIGDDVVAEWLKGGKNHGHGRRSPRVLQRRQHGAGRTPGHDQPVREPRTQAVEGPQERAAAVAGGGREAHRDR